MAVVVKVLDGPYALPNGGTYATDDFISLTAAQWASVTPDDIGVKLEARTAIVPEEVGLIGPPGPEGPAGADGAPGADGADGSPGADGKTILYGTAAPTTEGVDGDFYIRTTTNYIYGPKASGTWPAGTSLVGPTGATGAQGSAGADAATTVTINAQTDSYTLAIDDAVGVVVEMNKASANTLSIPTDAVVDFPVGTVIEVCQIGAGQTTIAAVTPGTTTVNAPGGKLKIAEQWGSVGLRKRAANTWVVSGDLAS